MLQSKAGYIDARPLTASSAKPLATHGRTIHWVNHVILRVPRSLPVYPYKQSSSGSVGMSQRCQTRTCATGAARRGSHPPWGMLAADRIARHRRGRDLGLRADWNRVMWRTDQTHSACRALAYGVLIA